MISSTVIKLTSCTSWGIIVMLGSVGGAPEPDANKQKCKPFGEYLVPKKDGSLKCHACSSCPEGTCFERHCSGYTDTLCRTPGPNEYVGGGVCLSCTDCGSRRIVLRGCIRNSDTKCGGCKSGYYWDEMVEDCIPYRHATKTYTTTAYFPQWSTTYAHLEKETTIDNSKPDNGEMTTAVKVGLIVPSVLLLLLIITGIIVLHRKKCRKKLPNICERMSSHLQYSGLKADD